MWVKFVVGSRPCSEGFSPGTPVFLPPQKPTFSIQTVDEEPLYGRATEIHIYLFILFYFISEEKT